jgi:UDP-N-acetylglucosamine--dolichyl-phosphate N-acetylglucosaminephosphotransferase
MLPALMAAVALSLVVSYWALGFLVPRLLNAGMSGKDVNKPNTPAVAEMGGLGAVAGLFFSVMLFALLGAAFSTLAASPAMLFAIVLSACMLSLIGAIDDLVSIPQLPKAFIPMAASIPIMMAMLGGATSIHLPLLGIVGFGILYYAVIALAITVSSNLTNMLAGFNGLEYGMAIPMYLGMLIISALAGNQTVALVAAAALGAFLAGFAFGFPKARAFPGDTATLLIGGLLAALMVAGRMEMYAIVFVPYLVDFAIKAFNGFPSSDWWGKWKDGKLYCPGERPRGFAQLVMKMSNGIEEQKLVLSFIALETVFAAAGVLLFVFRL